MKSLSDPFVLARVYKEFIYWLWVWVFEQDLRKLINLWEGSAWDKYRKLHVREGDSAARKDCTCEKEIARHERAGEVKRCGGGGGSHAVRCYSRLQAPTSDTWWRGSAQTPSYSGHILSYWILWFLFSRKWLKMRGFLVFPWVSPEDELVELTLDNSVFHVLVDSKEIAHQIISHLLWVGNLSVLTDEWTPTVVPSGVPQQLVQWHH
jgi:hypothetical protein